VEIATCHVEEMNLTVVGVHVLPFVIKNT